MKKKLKEIAIVQSGVYFKNEPDGEVLNLQVKDFTPSLTIRAGDKLKPTLPGDSRTAAHLLHEGNLLFASKGTYNFCAIYNKVVGKAVASSSFLVIRLAESCGVLPEYVAWYLNHPQTMQQLKLSARGTSIPAISKTTLEETEIHIPAIEKQQIIINLARLQKRERQLREQLALKKEMFINSLLMRSIY